MDSSIPCCKVVQMLARPPNRDVMRMIVDGWTDGWTNGGSDDG
jgi:hypothetical protein